MSAISVSGFEGVSTNNSRVFGRIARRHASVSVAGHKGGLDAQLGEDRREELHRRAEDAREATTWSPPFAAP